jgi:hypothetical protein
VVKIKPHIKIVNTFLSFFIFFRVKTNKHSGITNDLLRFRSAQARADDPEYIVRLIKKVVTVSVETVKIVKRPPEWELEKSHHAVGIIVICASGDAYD